MSETGRMRSPRHISGKPLHHLGHGYVALVDNADAEVSERAEGEVWIGFDGDNRIDIIFNPDSTDLGGQVSLSLAGDFARGCGLFVSEDLIFVWPIATARRRDRILMDFSAALASMS